MKYKKHQEPTAMVRKTHNPKVGGSNPPPATNLFNWLQASGANPKTILDHINLRFTGSRA
jgi:hypothetical protein